jgi:hypothetical protein
VESGQGRGESFKKHFVTNNTEMAEKTIFRLYYLPCLLSFVPSLSCLNPNVKNLPLSAPQHPQSETVDATVLVQNPIYQPHRQDKTNLLVNPQRLFLVESHYLDLLLLGYIRSHKLSKYIS